MRQLIYLFAVCMLASCSPKSLGYFETEPFFKPTVNTIEEPLYIEFGNHIKDDFSVAQPGMRTLNVKDFKQSMRFALTRTFDDQFKSVEFFAAEQEGFVLKVFRLEPSWWIGEEHEIVRKELNDKITVRDFGCQVKYESTLYYHGEKVSDANGEILKKADQQQAWTIEKLFEQAVKLSCEDMGRKISRRSNQ